MSTTATESPATKSIDVHVPPGATVGEAVQVAIDACLDHLRPNESCWLATEHADCLHQTRVSTRRLRALLSLSRDLIRRDPAAGSLKARLRLMLAPLGPARDLDVLLARAREEERSSADLTRIQTAHAEEYARARSVLTSPEWERIWAEFDAWRSSPTWLSHCAELRDEPARVVTDAPLDRRYRRIVAAGPQLLTMPDHALHRVRIEGKKLRYGCQFFDALYPEADALGFADTLSEMQDAFGAFNDYAVAGELTDSLGLDPAHLSDPPTREECVEAWHQVAALEPFWRTT